MVPRRLRAPAMLAALALLLAAAPVAGDDFVYGQSYLRDRTGAETSLARAADGDVLVAVILKGTWCHVCLRQLTELSRRKARLDALGVRVVGIAVEPHARTAAAEQRHALPFPILSDPDHGVVSSLGLWRPRWGHPLPSIVVFDRCGEERQRFEGRRPGLRPERALMHLLETMAKEEPKGCLTVLAQRSPALH